MSKNKEQKFLDELEELLKRSSDVLGYPERNLLWHKAKDLAFICKKRRKD